MSDKFPASDDFPEKLDLLATSFDTILQHTIHAHQGYWKIFKLRGTDAPIMMQITLDTENTLQKVTAQLEEKFGIDIFIIPSAENLADLKGTLSYDAMSRSIFLDANLMIAEHLPAIQQWSSALETNALQRDYHIKALTNEILSKNGGAAIEKDPYQTEHNRHIIESPDKAALFSTYQAIRNKIGEHATVFLGADGGYTTDQNFTNKTGNIRPPESLAALDLNMVALRHPNNLEKLEQLAHDTPNRPNRNDNNRSL